MTVIAMTREMGTRGKDVAAKLAKRLDIGVVHHELVERHIAERLNLSESAVHRFLEGEASLWERWNINEKSVSICSSEEVLQLAMHGNVLIRGWGAAQLLRDVGHVLRVRVCAPMADRIAEMKQRLGVDDDAVVRSEIERNDEAHERTVRNQFRTDWRDATGYDVVINTSHVAIDDAVDLLAGLARSASFAETDETRGRLADKFIGARARGVLGAQLIESPTGSSLDIDVVDGNVTIRGVVSSKADFRRQVEEIKKLSGVKQIHDETVAIPVSYGV